MSDEHEELPLGIGEDAITNVAETSIANNTTMPLQINDCAVSEDTIGGDGPYKNDPQDSNGPHHNGRNGNGQGTANAEAPTVDLTGNDEVENRYAVEA